MEYFSILVSLAGVMKLVTMRDSKSRVARLGSSSLPSGTNCIKQAKLLCLRTICAGAGIIFEYKNCRAGVANTYIEFKQSAELYLVIRDHSDGSTQTPVPFQV